MKIGSGKLLVSFIIVFVSVFFILPIIETSVVIKNEDPVEIKKKYVLNKYLMRICSCESTGSPENNPYLFHYEKDGSTPLIGKINPKDRGMCQLNLDAHLKTTLDMGLDVMNDQQDYIYYVNWLFKKQGSFPWRYSQHCWGN